MDPQQTPSPANNSYFSSNLPEPTEPQLPVQPPIEPATPSNTHRKKPTKLIIIIAAVVILLGLGAAAIVIKTQADNAAARYTKAISTQLNNFASAEEPAKQQESLKEHFKIDSVAFGTALSGAYSKASKEFSSQYEKFLNDAQPVVIQRASASDLGNFHRDVIKAMEFEVPNPAVPSDTSSANALEDASKVRVEKAAMYQKLSDRFKAYTYETAYKEYQDAIVQCMTGAYTAQSTMAKLQDGVAKGYLAMYQADEAKDQAASLKASAELAGFVANFNTTLPTITRTYDLSLTTYNKAVVELATKMKENNYVPSLAEKVTAFQANAKDLASTVAR